MLINTVEMQPLIESSDSETVKLKSAMKDSAISIGYVHIVFLSCLWMICGTKPTITLLMPV